VPLLVRDQCTQPPDNLRAYVASLFKPNVAGTTPLQFRQAEAWLKRWTLPLAEVSVTKATSVRDALGRLDDGTMAKASTAKRYRGPVRAMFREAVQFGMIPATPWPPPKPPRRKTRRKDAIKRSRFTRHIIMEPREFRLVASKLINHQPSSRKYFTYYAVRYFAGLRPHEALGLEQSDQHEDLELPEQGWGVIHVREGQEMADKRWRTAEDEDYVETKTGERKVPIPPELVDILKKHLDEFGPGRLFLTNKGKQFTYSNIWGAWDRAKKRAFPAGHRLRKCRPYDLRHSFGTLLLDAGKTFEEVADRMGNSPEQVANTYAGSLNSRVTATDERYEQLLRDL
jgi:integrase